MVSGPADPADAEFDSDGSDIPCAVAYGPQARCDDPGAVRSLAEWHAVAGDACRFLYEDRRGVEQILDGSRVSSGGYPRWALPIGGAAHRTTSIPESGDVCDSCHSLQTETGNFTMKRRTTVREVPCFDLSEAVEQYYRQLFEHEGRGPVFTQWMTALRADLADAASHDADAAFILHVLVCTWDRRVQRHSDSIDAIRRLSPKNKALLIGAVRLLGRLGEPWIKQVLGPPDSDRGMRFLVTVSELETALAGVVVRTPAWQSGVRSSGRVRTEENAVTACLVCVLDELKQHPKPTAAVANLLEKAGLLRRSRGGAAGAAFVAKRAARARTQAKDRLGAIGNVVWLLRSTYADLRESLLPIPEVPETDPVWNEHAPACGMTGPRYRQAFLGYCRARGVRAHIEALENFERELTSVRDHKGLPGVTQILRNFAGEPPEPPRDEKRRSTKSRN